MSDAGAAMPYESPQIRDHGHLSVLTAFDGGGLHFSLAAVGGSLPGGEGTPTPTPPGAVPTPAPTQGVLENTQSGGTPTGSADVPDATGVQGDTDSGGSGPSGGGGGGGSGGPGANGVESGSNGGGVASGGESLPFTGMAAGPVAALGAGLAAAGASLRRRTRRP